VLKMWTPNFDLTCEPVVLRKIWAIMPSLPLAFWTRNALEEIGNKLGVLIDLELSWDSKLDS
jgi:hypothetical protein